MKLIILFLLGVVSHSSLVYCVTTCNDFKTCKDCIGYASVRCVWCSLDIMNSSLPEKLSARCQPRTEVYKGDKFNTNWCPLNHINDPDSGKPNATVDNDFNAEKGKEIQFKPQKIEITLRPGVPATIDMLYRPAKDYPLDMYFVMDSSFTMRTYADKLAEQTMRIFDALVKMTNNVRMGIGTFVDKPALPYADPSIHTTCHAFKHRLSLTDNMTLFKDKIKSYRVDEKTDANYDLPESGLDALMQIMTCGNRIGWRTKSKAGGVEARRIIILATDATYHSAGDGKMVGAYKPNDMTCHLDADGLYNKIWSLTLDYPSVSQINHAVKENNVLIVFAVVNEVLAPYEALAKQIMGAKCVELQGDRIIQIIQDAYATASRDVVLNKDAPKWIKIETNCDEPGRCKSTNEKSTVTIKANITANDCNSDSDIVINPFGISDKLIIQVKIHCKCPCEGKTASFNSTDCSLAGKKLCGICECNTDRSGDKCEIECSSTRFLETKNQCKEHPDDNTDCNGEGNCVCGKCKCYNENGKSFSGTFCEHDDVLCRETCPVDRGDCKLGLCICKDPTQWIGLHCDCPVSKTTCVGPFSNEVCSGRGTCDCGQCKCKPRGGKEYFGNYCESCKDCAKELCEQLKEYAYCNYEKTPKADCDTKYNQTSVKEVIIMNRTALEAETTATGCRKKLSDGKIIIYKYQIVTDDTTGIAQLKLMIQDDLETPPVANIWITIGSVIGGVLLVGIMTIIIWKILTNMYDKKEYDKFCQEAAGAGFDVSNPVYQDPNVNFVNPAYKGNT